MTELRIVVVPGVQVVRRETGTPGVVEKVFVDKVRILVGKYRYLTVSLEDFQKEYEIREVQG